MKPRLYILSLTCVFFLLSLKVHASNQHSLLFTQQRIEQAKERVKTEPAMAKAFDSIKGQAEKLLLQKRPERLDYLALTYLMTGDRKYADKLTTVLLEMSADASWGNAEMLARTPAWNSELNMAHKSFYCAMAYDAIRDVLNKAQRKQIAHGLKRLALDPLLGDWILAPTRIHSLNSMGHNWWTSCTCMGGLLALSLRNDVDGAYEMAEAVYETLPEWFDFEGDNLQQKPKTFDEAGGMYECLNYANYGIQEALLFQLGWKNVHPGKTITTIPQLDLLPAFFSYICYPRTGMLYNINFGDSHKNTAAESSLMMLYALGYHDANILWYISQVEQGQHRDGYFLDRPMGFLYTPKLDKAPLRPNLNHSKLFADFGWATLRNSWDKDATMLAVKSGHTWNHSHADANSFILFHKGTDIIKDGGRCWYPNPEYRNYFFQSQAHNVVLFKGKGQLKEHQYYGSQLRGHLHHLLDAGNIKYVLANGTGPYADQFSRNYRHFLWIDNVIYIIDDLKTHEVGQFEWLWHPGGKAVKKGVDLHVTQGNSSVAVRPLYPQMLAKSNFVHDYPDDLYWKEIEAPTEDLKNKETYYSFCLPAEINRVKGVTAIILKETPDEKELPLIERREGKNWIGLRVRNKGKITDIYINQLADGRLMHSNSWIEADGWETDAYLFAVSYPENEKVENSDELCVVYGSALRRENRVYFSSLSKHYFISKQEKEKREIWITGAPKSKTYFEGNKRLPVLVNGKNGNVIHKQNMIQVKYEDD